MISQGCLDKIVWIVNAGLTLKPVYDWPGTEQTSLEAHFRKEKLKKHWFQRKSRDRELGSEL